MTHKVTSSGYYAHSYDKYNIDVDLLAFCHFSRGGTFAKRNIFRKSKSFVYS